MIFRSSHVKLWQVSELNNYLKELLASNPLLASLWVKGEISNLSQPRSGHIYFTLKDQLGSVRSVMFRSRAIKLPMPLRDGMEVLVRASLSIYERDGVYQLYVEEVQPLGAGDLHKAFEILKKQLEEEGLFQEERKKPLPFLPTAVGIVTSLTGAALQDILSVMTTRFPSMEIFVAPAQVQGVGASQSIAEGIRLFNRFEQVDIIIIGRGGGSLEELWAFNTEEVARAIASSKIPIVSAVGHETDYTIADLVADKRAPTPTAAAALVVPQYEDEKRKLDLILARAYRVLNNKLKVKQQGLENLLKYSVLNKPQMLYLDQKKHIDFLNKEIQQLGKQLINEYKTQLTYQAKKLDSLSPLKVLGRGYALCLNHEQKIISSIRQVNMDEALEVQLSDGKVDCLVQGVKVDEQRSKLELDL